MGREEDEGIRIWGDRGSGEEEIRGSGDGERLSAINYEL